MSMPISVCNDTFKINNVVFLPTKDVKKENHTIWVLEYSDNAVFIVDASTWDEIDEVIKETIRDMHSENAVLKRISSFTNLQDNHGLVMQEGRLGEIAKHFDLETIYPYANGWYFGENLYLANGDAWDGNNIYKVTVDSGLAWPMNVIVRALNSYDAVDKAVDFLHAEYRMSVTLRKMKARNMRMAVTGFTEITVPAMLEFCKLKLLWRIDFMGRGNICPDGKYEGVVYVDYDNVLCYTKKDDSEQRLLKDISYEEMPEFEFDDDASQLLLDEYRTNLVNEMMRRYQSFEEPNQTWLPNHRNGKVILENKLFYIIVEDNEWAEAVELIQKESEYGDVDLSGLQKQHYRHYLDAIQDILLEQFGEVGIYTGPWTSGKITKGESNGSQCGTKGAA